MQGANVIDRMRLWSAVSELGGQMTIETAMRIKEVPTRYALFKDPVSIIKWTHSYTCVFHTEIHSTRHSTLLFGASECPSDDFTMSQDEPDRAAHITPMGGKKTLALFPTRAYAKGSYAMTMRDDEEMERRMLNDETNIKDWVPVSTGRLLSRASDDAQILTNPHVRRVVEKAAPTMAWTDPELCALLSPHTLRVPRFPVCLSTWKIAAAVLLLCALVIVPFRSTLARALTPARESAREEEPPSVETKKKRAAKKKKKTLEVEKVEQVEQVEELVSDASEAQPPLDKPPQETGRSVSTPPPVATDGTVPTRADETASAIAEQLSRHLHEFRSTSYLGAEKSLMLITKIFTENTKLRDAVRDAQNEAAELRSQIFNFSRAIAQLHFYFTDPNPRRRSHLESLCNSAGYVELDTVLRFDLMASHAVTRSQMASLLAKSPVVEVAACGTLVRSRHRITT